MVDSDAHGHSNSLREPLRGNDKDDGDDEGEAQGEFDMLSWAGGRLEPMFSCIAGVVNKSVGWIFVDDGSNDADRKLKVAIVVALFFMFVEIIGGVIANSLAIVVDAAHMLSDVCGYIISLVAIQMTRRSSNEIFTYGYRQAEVLGGAMSVFLVWIMSFGLFIEAIGRFMNPQPIDAPIMLVLACIGLVVNVVVMAILSDSGHGHSHGGLPGAGGG